jgi:hypothetical protein
MHHFRQARNMFLSARGWYLGHTNEKCVMQEQGEYDQRHYPGC